MHTKSQAILDQLSDINKQIRYLQEKKRTVLESCTHLDMVLSYVETFAWEHQLMYVCKVCYTQLRDIPIDREVAIKFYMEYFDSNNREEAEKKCMGFNLDLPSRSSI